MTRHEIMTIIKEEVARETGLPLTEIEERADFFSLGLDSIRAVYVLDQLEKKLKMELNPIYFWDYPTIGALSEFLATLRK
jgi:acyl carrier protein